MDGARVGRHLETARGVLVHCGARIGRTSDELVFRTRVRAVRVCDDIEVAPTTCLFISNTVVSNRAAVPGDTVDLLTCSAY